MAWNKGKLIVAVFVYLRFVKQPFILMLKAFQGQGEQEPSHVIGINKWLNGRSLLFPQEPEV